MMKLCAALLTSLAIVPLARADQSTLKQSDDIKVVKYSAVHRQTLSGTVGDPTTITFPANESVYAVNQSVQIGPDGSVGNGKWLTGCKDNNEGKPCQWQGNNLTLWPGRSGRGYMTIITCTKPTDDEGHCLSQKAYPFYMIANPAEADPNIPMVRTAANSSTAPAVTAPPPVDPVHNIIYAGGARVATGSQGGSQGSGEYRGERRSRRRALADRDAEDAANQRIRADNLYGLAGCQYQPKGKYPNPLTPLCPQSNGQWLRMRFPGLQDLPTPYVEIDSKGCRDEKGEGERSARWHADGDYLVVEEHVQKLCLRMVPYVLELIDTAWNPVGNVPNSGTPVPGVKRDILRAESP